MVDVIWRDFFSGRGPRGIVYPDPPNAKNYFRRNVNLIGGMVDSVSKVEDVVLEVEERRAHGRSSEEADKCVELDGKDRVLRS